MKNKGNPPKIFLYISLFFIILLLIFLNVYVAKTTGTLIIKDIIVTSGIDPNGIPLASRDIFPVNQERIFCYISVFSPKPVRVGVRWYLREILIFEEENLVNGWRAFFIEPQQGENFPIGEYRVEIYLVRKSIRTVYFSVE